MATSCAHKCLNGCFEVLTIPPGLSIDAHDEWEKVRWPGGGPCLVGTFNVYTLHFSGNRPIHGAVSACILPKSRAF